MAELVEQHNQPENLRRAVSTRRSWHLGQYVLFREPPGVVSEGVAWGLLDEEGYLYLESSPIRLAWAVVSQWRQDQNLVG